MKKYRIGKYEYIFDSRLVSDEPKHVVKRDVETPKMATVSLAELLDSRGVPPKEGGEPPRSMAHGALTERVLEADRLRQEGFNVFIPPPSRGLTAEEEAEAKRQLELKRRRKNREYNDLIDGRHFFGCVFYRVRQYSGFSSWVFRTTSKEYSFTRLNTSALTKTQGALADNHPFVTRYGGQRQSGSPLEAWMGKDGQGHKSAQPFPRTRP
jgi:hypothetical protein